MENLFVELEKGSGKLPYVPIVPCRQLVIPNDKLTETIFSFTDDEYQTLITKSYALVEKKPTKKHDEILTKFSLRPNTSNTEPLNQFDRAVLSVMMSLYLAGNRFITSDMVYRGLCGKSNTNNGRNYATPALENAIKKSVDKMAFSKFSVDMTDLLKNSKYEGLKSPEKPVRFLPCCYAENVVSIGGHSNHTVFDVSHTAILYDIAKAKRQLLTCDIRLLDVPNQHNSVEMIAVKHYVLQRVLECKRHYKNMTPTITLSDVFDKCRLNDVTAKRKQRICQYILAFMEHLTKCKSISSYESFFYRKQLVSIKFFRQK